MAAYNVYICLYTMLQCSAGEMRKLTQIHFGPCDLRQYLINKTSLKIASKKFL